MLCTEYYLNLTHRCIAIYLQYYVTYMTMMDKRGLVYERDESRLYLFFSYFFYENTFILEYFSCEYDLTLSVELTQTINLPVFTYNIFLQLPCMG